VNVARHRGGDQMPMLLLDAPHLKPPGPVQCAKDRRKKAVQR
jgi:hypothetical protein